MRVQPLPGVPVAVDLERRFALGSFSRSAFAARVSGGAATSTRAFGRKLNISGYGEAGIVGFDFPTPISTPAARRAGERRCSRWGG